MEMGNALAILKMAQLTKEVNPIGYFTTNSVRFEQC
jgi:hypothetical protein